MRTRLAAVLLALLAVLAPAVASACSVPVFRYALERWPAEIYPVYVLHKGALSADDAKTVEWMNACANDGNVPSNICVVDVDLNSPAEKRDAGANDVVARHPVAELPMLVVAWPDVYERNKDAWTGPLNRENAKALLDSPARREIAKHLLSGDVCVWVVISGDDKSADGEIESLLKTESEKLVKTIELPEIDPMDVEEGTAPPELKLSFSTVRISRDDPAEKIFLAMVLAADRDVPGDKPALSPIFGQGRLLCTLGSADVKADTLAQIGEFLCGSCSCIVKDQNPGIDMLMSANWSALPEAKFVKPQEPPPLTGLGAAAQAPAQRKPPPPFLPNVYVLGPTVFLVIAGIVAVAGLLVLVIVIIRRPGSGA